MASSLTLLLIIDTVFLFAIGGLIYYAMRKKHAGMAVFNRNFVGYFSNPTGYLFVLLFVALCSAGAFFPDDFFGDNLANLAQLNKWFPWIMLFYIPTITMGIWSEERRQGTDELLLTVPASDWDIVIGKYLAAVGIFTASLVFSQISNFLVLGFLSLAELDTGLFVTTYLGYWFIGLAMIALGMAGSFLTRNLTIGFILGVAINSPLVLGAYAESLFAWDFAKGVHWTIAWVESWSGADFGEGVLSARGIIFYVVLVLFFALFTGIAAVLTRKIFVSYICGMVMMGFVMAGTIATSVFGDDFARELSRFSYGEQFFDFGRGVISLRAIAFFLLVVAVGLYLSIVFVGRRHWLGGKDGQSLLGHYLVRVVSLMAVAFGVTYFLINNDRGHLDGTFQQVNSLSSDTITHIRDLKDSEDQRAVLIEAFISAKLPDIYTKTKVDLISKLREFDSRGGSRIQVRIYDNLDPSDEAAVRAEEQYGISTRRVTFRQRGETVQDDIFMGAAFSSGLERVVVPFFDQGIPVEYELIRSIATVTGDQRRRLGIVNTDARLFGGFNMQTMSQTPKQQIVEELEKQYEVVQIDPNSPIEEEVDVLMVVQPSSLTQPQMDNLVAAIGKGVPTALFEDPVPYFFNGVPGTGQPKPPRGGGMMGMGQPPEPKADLQPLLSLLGIQLVGQPGMMGGFDASVVWQDYMPYKKLERFGIPDEWVFASPDAPGGAAALSPDSPIVSGMQQILFVYPTAILDQKKAGLTVTPIVTTGSESGTVSFQRLRESTEAELKLVRKLGQQPNLVLAVRIQGSAGADASVSQLPGDNVTQLVAAVEEDVSSSEQPATDGDSPSINAVFVSDIDLMHTTFIDVRAQANMMDVNFNFDNVAFVLNVVDDLAGDDRFLEVRKKQPRHSTLKLVEARSADARESAEERQAEFTAEFEQAETEAQQAQQQALAELRGKIAELETKAQETGSGRDLRRELQAAVQQMAMKEQVEQRRFETLIQGKRRERDREIRRIERDLDGTIRNVKEICKWMALILPTLPPIAIGLAVFARRRALESEGISAGRQR